MAKRKRQYVGIGSLRRGDSVRVYVEHRETPRRSRMELWDEGTVATIEGVTGAHKRVLDVLGRELVTSYSTGKKIERVARA